MATARPCCKIPSIISQSPSCSTCFRTSYPLSTRTALDWVTSERNVKAKAWGKCQRGAGGHRGQRQSWHADIRANDRKRENLFSLIKDCKVLTQLWAQWRGGDSAKGRQNASHKTLSTTKEVRSERNFFERRGKARRLFSSSKGRKKQMNQKSKIEYHWSCWQSNQQSPHSKCRGLLNKAKEFESLEQNRVFPFIKLDIILEQHFDLGAVKNFCIKNI